MSQIFYDQLIILNNLEQKIIDLELEPEEKEVLNQLVEETVHYRVITKILDALSQEYHEEFLNFFHQAPHAENIFIYLQEKIMDLETLIKQEIEDFEKTLLEELTV